MECYSHHAHICLRMRNSKFLIARKWLCRLNAFVSWWIILWRWMPNTYLCTLQLSRSENSDILIANRLFTLANMCRGRYLETDEAVLQRQPRNDDRFANDSIHPPNRSYPHPQLYSIEYCMNSILTSAYSSAPRHTVAATCRLWKSNCHL